MNLSKIFESNFQKMFTGFLETLPDIVIAVFALIITNFIARLVKRILPRTLQRAKLQVALSQFLTSVISFLIWTTGIIIAVSLSFPTVTFAKMLTALGLGSIAIGFAFKDIFENFMAGVLVLIREPFQIGDFIEVDGTRGFVHFVSIRDTIIYTLDDDKIVVYHKKGCSTLDTKTCAISNLVRAHGVYWQLMIVDERILEGQSFGRRG